MASKKLVIRGGLDLNSALSSGGSDPVLTRNTTTKEVGETTPLLVGLPTTLLQGYIYIGDNTNTAQARLPIGDVNVTYLGLVTINDGVITNNKISPTAAIAYSKLNLNNSIVNADIAVAAAIVRSKLASGSANRLVINNGSGVMTDATTITPNKVLISDSNGIPTHSVVTSTTLTYLDATSSIQTQFNNKLQFDSSIVPVEGDLVAYLSGQWQRFPRGTSGQYLSSTPSTLQWVSVPSGIPIGGTTDQYLSKVDNTDYNTQWTSLTLSKVVDVTAVAADVNLLQGLDAFGVTQLNFQTLQGAASNIQGQLNTKIANVLAQNYMFIGNAAGQVSTLAPGTNSYVLTMVSGAPTWAAATGGGGSGHVIQNDGLDLPTETHLNFTGGLEASDDPGNTATKAQVNTAYNFAWTGIHSWLDNGFSIKDNTDPSKIINFQVSGLTTATTRTFSWPDVTGTVALIDGGQTFTSAIWNATPIDNSYLVNSAITIAGNITSLGSSVTQDQITGLSSTGIIKRTGANTLSIATGSDINTTLGSQTANTVYAAPTGSAGNPSFRTLTTADIPSISGTYVPYTGATANVLLGAFYVNPKYVLLSDQTAPAAPASGNLILQSFNQQGFSVPHVYDPQGNAIEITRDSLTIVRNNSGSTLTKGTVVYVTGSTGAVPIVDKAKADSLTTLPAVFILYEDIVNNAYGRGMILGNLENVNMSAFAAGDLLYVSEVTPGALTNAKPTYPNFSQSIGTVLNNGVGNGVLEVFVRVVGGAASITDGQALTKTDDTNVTITLGGTPSTALVRPASITLGWTGTLAYSRFVNGAGLSIVGRSANSAGVQADIVGTNNQVLRVSGTTLGFGSIDLSQSATVGTGRLAYANITQGSAHSILGVTGNATADLASIQSGSAYNILRANSTNTGVDFGSIDLSQSGAVGSSILGIANGGTGSSSVTSWLLASGGTASGTNTFAFGTNPWIITTGVTTGTGATAGMQFVANSLTTGNGIDASSSSITTGNLLKLTSTSTAGNSFSLSNINSSGANANSTRTATGETISVTNTGTSSTNVGLNVTASGGSNNYAILATGRVGIGNSAPSGILHVTGSGSVPTIQIVGTGTSTNYSIRSFQSDGTTEIFSLKDNGLFAFTSTVNGSAFSSSWTATANNQSAFSFGGTVISENVNSDTLNYFVVNPTLNRNAGAPTSQTLQAMLISPAFDNLAATQTVLIIKPTTTLTTGANYYFRVNNSAGTELFNIGGTSSNSVNVTIGAAAQATARLFVAAASPGGTIAINSQGVGTGNGGTNFRTTNSATTPTFLIRDNGEISGTQVIVGGAGVSSAYVSLTQAATSSTSGTTGFLFTNGAHTSQTLETIDFNIANNRTVSYFSGTSIATQRSIVFNAPTYSSSSATITNLYNLYIAGAPAVASSLTSTNSYGIYMDTRSVTSGVINSYGAYINAQTGATNNYAAQFAGGVVLAPNFVDAYSTTATGAATTTLTTNSNYFQAFTGSTTQTVALPVVTTMVTGQMFFITNASSGTVTVQTSGGNTIKAMAANSTLMVWVINTSGGTGTASWNWQYTATLNN